MVKFCTVATVVFLSTPAQVWFSELQSSLTFTTSIQSINENALSQCVYTEHFVPVKNTAFGCISETGTVQRNSASSREENKRPLTSYQRQKYIIHHAVNSILWIARECTTENNRWNIAHSTGFNKPKQFEMSSHLLCNCITALWVNQTLINICLCFSNTTGQNHRSKDSCKVSRNVFSYQHIYLKSLLCTIKAATLLSAWLYEISWFRI